MLRFGTVTRAHAVENHGVMKLQFNIEGFGGKASIADPMRSSYFETESLHETGFMRISIAPRHLSASRFHNVAPKRYHQDEA